MKRCSLFFLAFVTTLLLAAVSGSFQDGRETPVKGVDARDAMIATRETEVKHSLQDHLPVTGSAIPKTQNP